MVLFLLCFTSKAGITANAVNERKEKIWQENVIFVGMTEGQEKDVVTRVNHVPTIATSRLNLL